MKFSINPTSPNEFSQWKEAIRATARLPEGLPNQFRKDVRFLRLITNTLLSSNFVSIFP